MAFRASGIPSFNLGTVKAAPRPRRRRGGVRGQGGAMAMAPTMDRNYEQQIDDREQRQALDLIKAQKAVAGAQRTAPVRQQPAAAQPAPYVSGEQEWAQMGGKTLAQIATEDPGQAANRNQSLIDFAGELMGQVPDGSGRVVLSKSQVAQLPGFVSGMSAWREPRRVYVQREKSESGAEVLAFYEQGDDGASLPVLNNGAPVRLNAELMRNAANVSWLGRDRVNQIEDKKMAMEMAMDLERVKAENKSGNWKKIKAVVGTDEMGGPIEQEVMFDPDSGRTVMPFVDVVKGMSDKDAEAVAEDVADNIAGYFSSDANDFRQWGGRSAFVASTKQELINGLYDKKRQDLLSNPDAVIKRLKERGGTKVEIQNTFKRYGVDMPAAVKPAVKPDVKPAPVKPAVPLTPQQKRAQISSLGGMANAAVNSPVAQALKTGAATVAVAGMDVAQGAAKLFTGDPAKDEPLLRGYLRSWDQLDDATKAQARRELADLAATGNGWASTQLIGLVREGR